MSKTLSNLIFTVAVSFFFFNCANRGTPTGGDKDITPPVITKSLPENYSINFNSEEIKMRLHESRLTEKPRTDKSATRFLPTENRAII